HLTPPAPSPPYPLSLHDALPICLLIINADDFGLNRAATDAIVECHRAGTVTSTTLMANTPDCTRAAQLSAALTSLGVGLHFNLTWGEPLAGADRVPTLVDARGHLLARDALARRLLLRKVAARDVAEELRAQWAHLRGLGLHPSHVDSHQHVHGFPLVFSAVADMCRAERIPMRVPWVAPGKQGGWGRRARRFLLARMLRNSVRRWQGQVRWNDSLNSVFDLPGLSRE